MKFILFALTAFSVSGCSCSEMKAWSDNHNKLKAECQSKGGRYVRPPGEDYMCLKVVN